MTQTSKQGLCKRCGKANCDTMTAEDWERGMKWLASLPKLPEDTTEDPELFI